MGERIVLDSWAVLAFLHKEGPHVKVHKVLQDASKGKKDLSISVINLAEVYYKLIRSVGKKEAVKTISSLRELPWEVIPASDENVFLAAKIKARHPIALADCFAVASAQQKKASILTGDPEFERVEKIVKIMWLS